MSFSRPSWLFCDAQSLRSAEMADSVASFRLSLRRSSKRSFLSRADRRPFEDAPSREQVGLGPDAPSFATEDTFDFFDFRELKAAFASSCRRPSSVGFSSAPFAEASERLDRRLRCASLPASGADSPCAWASGGFIGEKEGDGEEKVKSHRPSSLWKSRRKASPERGAAGAVSRRLRSSRPGLVRSALFSD